MPKPDEGPVFDRAGRPGEAAAISLVSGFVLLLIGTCASVGLFSQDTIGVAIGVVGVGAIVGVLATSGRGNEPWGRTAFFDGLTGHSLVAGLAGFEILFAATEWSPPARTIASVVSPALLGVGVGRVDMVGRAAIWSWLPATALVVLLVGPAHVLDVPAQLHDLFVAPRVFCGDLACLPSTFVGGILVGSAAYSVGSLAGLLWRAHSSVSASST